MLRGALALSVVLLLCLSHRLVTQPLTHGSESNARLLGVSGNRPSPSPTAAVLGAVQVEACAAGCGD